MLLGDLLPDEIKPQKNAGVDGVLHGLKMAAQADGWSLSVDKMNQAGTSHYVEFVHPQAVRAVRLRVSDHYGLTYDCDGSAVLIDGKLHVQTSTASQTLHPNDVSRAYSLLFTQPCS